MGDGNTVTLEALYIGQEGSEITHSPVNLEGDLVCVGGPVSKIMTIAGGRVIAVCSRCNSQVPLGATEIVGLAHLTM